MDEHARAPDMVVSDEVLAKWQAIVDLMAEMIGVPAALIMRIVESDIEVFVSSKSPGNPYRPGSRERLVGSGLYCETVVRTKSRLLVPNALADERWRNNPDIKHRMISYLGFPILLPNRKPFGTICVLDNKESSFATSYERLLLSFRDVIQSHLDLIYMNHALGEDNKNLNDCITEIKALRGILPICAFCKKIRDDDGYWQAVESYMSKHVGVRFSHSFCPECARKHYPEIYAEPLKPQPKD